MQHSGGIELVDLSTLFSFSLAERRWAAVVAEEQVSRLRFAVLAEFLPQTELCIVKEAMVDHRLSLRIYARRLSKMTEDAIWYTGWPDDMMSSFDVFSLLSDDLTKPE